MRMKINPQKMESISTRSREQKVKPVATANLPARVGPGAKLEVALLVVEGKPRDVDLAR